MTQENICHSGYVMIYVILGFALIAIIGLSIMNLTRLETKTCSYSSELKQAHEAARAGVEWALEGMFTALQEQASEENLPPYLLDSQDCSVWADASNLTFFKVESPGATLTAVDKESCTYTLSCTGVNQRSHRTLRVLCKYAFTNVYDAGDGGEPVFKYRVFSDRGRLVELRIEQ
ncbi:MAG TPA: hypothetical protein VN426_03700 [Syntrophomonadaceae bacterium]|nr:hypothetical protein [Syntrophomonadaceae bacterium]